MSKKSPSIKVGCKKIFGRKRMWKDLMHNNSGNGRDKNIDFSKKIKSQLILFFHEIWLLIFNSLGDQGT
jgi:hypothetical protein